MTTQVKLSDGRTHSVNISIIHIIPAYTPDMKVIELPTNNPKIAEKIADFAHHYHYAESANLKSLTSMEFMNNNDELEWVNNFINIPTPDVIELSTVAMNIGISHPGIASLVEICAFACANLLKDLSINEITELFGGDTASETTNDYIHDQWFKL